MENLDVKTTFCPEELDEVIYISQPQGFMVKDKSQLNLRRICMVLSKFISNGTKDLMHTYVLKIDFKRTEYNIFLYYNNAEGVYAVYLLLYVENHY